MAETRGRAGFAVFVTAAAVLVVAVVIGIVIAVNAGSAKTATPDGGDGAKPSGSIIDTKTGAITFGEASAKNEIATYIDFMCPVCNQFEKNYGTLLKDQVASKNSRVEVHPVAILDRLSNGTEYSTRSASAMYCVAEYNPEQAWPFLTAMYANQPKEQSDGLTDAKIVDIAHGVGATASGLDSCITSTRYKQYVQSMTEGLPADPSTGQAGTPTVLVNGTYIQYKDLATGDPSAITSHLK